MISLLQFNYIEGEFLKYKSKFRPIEHWHIGEQENWFNSIMEVLL